MHFRCWARYCRRSWLLVSQVLVLVGLVALAFVR